VIHLFSYTPVWSSIFWFQKIWYSDTTSQLSFGKHFSGILFFFLFLSPFSYLTGIGVCSQGYSRQDMWLTLYFHLLPRLRICRHTPPTGMHEEGHLELYTISRIFLQNKWPVQLTWVRLTPTLNDSVHMRRCYRYLTVILVPQTSKGKRCSKTSPEVRNSFLSTFISITVSCNCTISCPFSHLQSWINCGLTAFTSSLQKILFF
jgi:hypothetical protein